MEYDFKLLYYTLVVAVFLKVMHTDR